MHTSDIPERPPGPQLADLEHDLAALTHTLQQVSKQVLDLRTSAVTATPESTNAQGLLASFDAEADRLRGLLERHPLQVGCDPLVDEPVASDDPGDGSAERSFELLTRLDALDAESGDVLEAMRAPRAGDNGLPRAMARAAAVPAPRTFKVGMHGDDVSAWQRQVNRQLEDWRINYELDVDGLYGDLSRRWSKRVLYGLGMSINPWHGVTLEARIKARHPESRSPEERATARERRKWLRRLRARYNRVHTPVEKIITSSNGYSSFHDGIDLICPPEALIFAVCRAKVIDVRSGGWWGNNPTGNVSLGDGIIQLEALTSIGPLRKGMHIGYGHAEHARVNVGQEVKAGDVLGRAGLANAWHVHFMMNKGDTMRGVGDFDPRACLNLFTSRGSD